MTRSSQKTFAIAATLSLLVVALLYGLFEARRLIAGPVLTIESPAPGSRIVSTLILRGIAKNISYITLNDRKIFVDERGVFEETLTPAKGYTVVAVEVRDRFGRVNRKELPVVIE
ncbi:MAG TPA: hypothetical protein VJG29_02115 [Candidatus Paceibacterota bacterium]